MINPINCVTSQYHTAQSGGDSTESTGRVPLIDEGFKRGGVPGAESGRVEWLQPRLERNLVYNSHTISRYDEYSPEA